MNLHILQYLQINELSSECEKQNILQMGNFKILHSTTDAINEFSFVRKFLSRNNSPFKVNSSEFSHGKNILCQYLLQSRLRVQNHWFINLEEFLLFVNRKKYILQLVCDISEFVYVQDCAGHLMLIMSATFSAAIMMAAIGFAFGTMGKMEASATRMFGMPCTRSSESTTAVGSVLGPILHVPD